MQLLACKRADEVDASRIAWKKPERCWWIDASKTIQLFSVGCNSRPESESVHTKLNDMIHKLQLEGYSPTLQWASQVILDDEKENMLCGHTEKLGMTVAFMNSPEVHLCVTKNMHVCGDCHLATLLISKMEKHKIEVADANCIHIFEAGVCICESYWWYELLGFSKVKFMQYGSL